MFFNFAAIVIEEHKKVKGGAQYICGAALADKGYYQSRISTETFLPFL